MAHFDKRVVFICGNCGSSNVISDTRAEWDMDRQEWVIVGHYDSFECSSCSEESSLIEVELKKAITE